MSSSPGAMGCVSCAWRSWQSSKCTQLFFCKSNF